MGRRIKRSKKVVRTVSRKNSNRRMTQRRVNKRRMTQRRVNKRRVNKRNMTKRRVNKRNMTKRNVARRIKRTNRKLLKTLKRLRGGELSEEQAKAVTRMFGRKAGSKKLGSKKKRRALEMYRANQAEKEAQEIMEKARMAAELEEEKARLAAEQEAKARLAAEKEGFVDGLDYLDDLDDPNDKIYYLDGIDDPDGSMEGGGYNRTNQNRRK